MIFVTGDTHIPLDIGKLMKDDFSGGKKLTSEDYVIVCGDFGGVWDLSRKRQEIMEQLNTRGFTTLFLDGNHENFDLLNAYPVEEWCGGKTHLILENIRHLMRGQIFEIDGLRFFTMGGANSIDKGHRMPGQSWWPEELPSEAEYREAKYNLERVGHEVDYVLTHTAPLKIIRQFYEPVEEFELCAFLEDVKSCTNYKKWFFGHVHDDVDVDDKHILLYDRILRIQ